MVRSIPHCSLSHSKAVYLSDSPKSSGGILRLNAIAGVSSISVSKDMCGLTLLYHFMNLVRGSVSIGGELIGHPVLGGPATSQNRCSLRCTSPFTFSTLPVNCDCIKLGAFLLN